MECLDLQMVKKKGPGTSKLPFRNRNQLHPDRRNQRNFTGIIRKIKTNLSDIPELKVQLRLSDRIIHLLTLNWLQTGLIGNEGV
jgi:hypothetical protein